ncbi:unnamed protein product [Gongylonema pulchrum]|uniref:Uncharacterized protein n=1 Tax=Gongylonema pulchrum TaxID=637853 RepID=A0A183DD91_9BILA|nr:unnamed protein product [Gongylonema pulchrum]
MQRLQVILDKFAPNTLFDAPFTHRFGAVDGTALLEKISSRHLDYINFALDKSSYSSLSGYVRQYAVLPSTDVKAVVMILFTLKLMFGLNDSTEFAMESRLLCEILRRMVITLLVILLFIF